MQGVMCKMNLPTPRSGRSIVVTSILGMDTDDVTTYWYMGAKDIYVLDQLRQTSMTSQMA